MPEPDAHPAQISQPVEIRAERLSKGFDGHPVLKDISLTINRGQIVAIVGASGSGKTVTLDLLTGLMKPDGGRVLVADHSKRGAPLVDINTLEWDELDAVRLSWAVVFQKNALFSGSVKDNVALWLREHTTMSEDQIDQRVRDSIRAAALDVDAVLDKARDELSGGMAKRVAVARAIAIDPVLIFYDEPTTGLDPIIAGQIHELIYTVHHRPRDDGSPRTTIIVTHDKELLRRLQPRVIMLHEGTICFDGPYENFGLPGCEPAIEYLRTMPVLHGRPVQ